MGRLPVIQNEKNIGRDHNTHGFSMWLAGGGFKGGLAYGATDEFGHKAVENIVNHFDYHATLLHLFGLDPQKLTFLRRALSDHYSTAKSERSLGSLEPKRDDSVSEVSWWEKLENFSPQSGCVSFQE